MFVYTMYLVVYLRHTFLDKPALFLIQRYFLNSLRVFSSLFWMFDWITELLVFCQYLNENLMRIIRPETAMVNVENKTLLLMLL